MDHHAQRALDELDRARGATSLEAAEAHLALSELHLMEIRSISEEPAPPALRLVTDEEAPALAAESLASG
jgi:hypothetical protein